jgi:hypothetical protein
MPPVEYNSCEGRNATAFNLLYTLQNGVPVLNTGEGSILASVINKAKRLGWLLENDKSSISECVLSYPNSKWYSLYIVDKDDNETWTTGTGTVYDHRIFFKIVPDVDGTPKAKVQDVMPPELRGKQPCQVINGQCVSPTANPAAVVAQTTAAAPKVPRSRAAKTYDPGASSSTAPAIQLQAEIEQRLNQLNISGQGNRESREQFSRDYFENMNNKMTIIEWMVDHMATPDIVSCIKNKNTNAADVRAAEAVAASVPSRVNPYQADRTSVAGPSESIPQVDQVAARAVSIASSMSEEDLDRTLKEVSIQEIMDDIRRKHTDRMSQLNAIKALCGTTQPLEVRQETSRRGVVTYNLYNSDGEKLDIDEALEDCAAVKAFEIKRRIRQQAAVMGRLPGMLQPAVARAKQRVSVRNAAMARQAMQAREAYSIASTAAQAVTSGPILTKDEIMEMGADGREILINYVMSLNQGYSTKQNAKGITVIVKPDGTVMKWNEETLDFILEEKRKQASSKASSKASSIASFESVDDIVDRIMGLPTLQDQIQALIVEARNVLYDIKESNGRYYVLDGKTKKYFNDGNVINEDLLYEIATVVADENKTAFGRKRSKKTKKCAKKVKKTKKGKRCSKKVKRCSKKASDDTDSESDDDEPKKKRKSKKTVKKGKKTVKKGCKGKVSKKQAAHRKRFSIAVKKCKGKSNYQSCMKKALSCKRSAFGKKRAVKMAGNKTYTKSGALRKKFLKSRGRMSPNVSATSKPVGTKMVGNNGGMWVIKKTVTGVKRWVKV